MVLDSSAILAILLDEPERRSFTRLIEQDSTRLVSAATLVEVTMVIESRKGEPGRRLLGQFLELTGGRDRARDGRRRQSMPATPSAATARGATPPASISVTCSPTRSPKPRANHSCSRATISSTPTSRAPPDSEPELANPKQPVGRGEACLPTFFPYALTHNDRAGRLCAMAAR